MAGGRGGNGLKHFFRRSHGELFNHELLAIFLGLVVGLVEPGFRDQPQIINLILGKQLLPH